MAVFETVENEHAENEHAEFGHGHFLRENATHDRLQPVKTNAHFLC